MTAEIETHHLADDGTIPNNPRLPLLVYRRAVTPDAEDPEGAFQRLFRSHGWHGCWVNGIYDWHHYHSTAHEVLGIARGWARVQFGGPQGVVAEVEAGDAVLIPAGVGHCRQAAKGLSVVGAYPPGQDWDMCGSDAADRAKALANIPRVPVPEQDPIAGCNGAIQAQWQ